MRIFDRYILLQAYGNTGILAECRLALMKLLKHHDPDDFTLVLYTDQPDYFEAELKQFLNPVVKLLTPELIKEWRGEIDFVHRVKIKMLIDFFSEFKGCVFYCDTDTFATGFLSLNLNDVYNGILYMHTEEGKIGAQKNADSRKWKKFFSKPFVAGDIKIESPFRYSMWNAGVIGMSSDQARYLPQVLAITDALYPHFPRHTVEQFAFSYVMQSFCPVRPIAKYIYHYWDLKEYRTLLEDFFAVHGNKSTEEQLRLLEPVMPDRLMAEKQQYKQLPFYRKIFAPKWDIRQYYGSW